ncbi:hypothetical protein MMC26_007685, partial [Xylographa opegraphella]|nr:hypothetical protein [Xylographa opegraphella]
EYDLGKNLAHLSRNNPSATFGNIWPREGRVPFFREWKRKAMAKRSDAGLAVFDREDAELMGTRAEEG